MNLNSIVHVTLTEYGAARLNGIISRLKQVIPYFKPHIYKEGDVYETELWSLFDDFGDMVYPTSQIMPFKDDEIELSK